MRLTLAILTAISFLHARPLAAADSGLARLAWMEGTWRGTTQGVAMEEIWSSPSGGSLIGMHRDSRDGRMVSFEFFRIVPMDSGGICYLSSPMGRPAVPFCAKEIGERRVVFENLAHDFPQRILYWLGEDGRMHARIENAGAETPKPMEWAWSRKTK